MLSKTDKSPRTGIIQKIVEKSANLKKKGEISRPVLSRLTTYNERGNPLVETIYQDDEMPIQRWVYQLDDRLPHAITAYYADQEGRLHLEWFEVTTNDPQKREETIRHFDGVGALEYYKTDTLDPQNRVIASAEYTPEGRLKNRSRFAYRSGEGEEEVAMYDLDDVCREKTISRFDADHRIKEEEVLRSDGTRSRLFREYHSNGTIKKEVSMDKVTHSPGRTGGRTFSEGESRTEQQFDDQGNIITLVMYAGDESIEQMLSYAYQFDDRGKWITRTMSEWVNDSDEKGLQPSETTYRTITYFETSLVPQAPFPRALGASQLPQIFECAYCAVDIVGDFSSCPHCDHHFEEPIPF